MVRWRASGSGPLHKKQEKGRDMDDAAHLERIQRTVLLVDDHPSIRLIISAGLKANGFSVLAASTGEQALEICRNHPGDIDVLLSDLGLTPNELKPEEGHSTDEPITNGLTLLNVSSNWTPFAYGGVLVAAVGIEALRNTMERQLRVRQARIEAEAA